LKGEGLGEGERRGVLSGYRLMWMMVIFDLPVKTRRHRKDATGFRKFLLDQGFGMCQLSVYLRFCGGKEQASAYTRRVQAALPPEGSVQVLYFTDKQYENIVSFRSAKRQPRNKNPQQYTMF
jgi:CRISPR-associated protein Cas2